MNEYWQDIKGYEGIYQVSNTGKVKSFYKNGHTHILKPILNHKGYGRVTLCNRHGGRIIHTVHRIVCETFIPNPQNKPQINHIDGNKLNNNVSNLEWCTAKENTIHRELVCKPLKYGTI